MTPLHKATHGEGYEDNRKEIVQLLIDRGADFNKGDAEGNTAVHHAALNDHLDLVQLLNERGADPNCANVAGYTANDYIAGMLKIQAFVSGCLPPGMYKSHHHPPTDA